MYKHFTKEQIQELSTIFGMQPVDQDTLPVRDGRVTRKHSVWWWSSSGPEYVLAQAHWGNIRSYPKIYSLVKPGVIVEYPELKKEQA